MIVSSCNQKIFIIIFLMAKIPPLIKRAQTNCNKCRRKLEAKEKAELIINLRLKTVEPIK